MHSGVKNTLDMRIKLCTSTYLDLGDFSVVPLQFGEAQMIFARLLRCRLTDLQNEDAAPCTAAPHPQGLMNNSIFVQQMT